jgi:hypothetical protein
VGHFPTSNLEGAGADVQVADDGARRLAGVKGAPAFKVVA